MKRLRIGRRRARVERATSPLELALAPAVSDGRWDIPDRFNFTRDVVEALAEDPKRRAITFSGHDGIIEPRTFAQLAEGAARWAAVLHERGVRPGDRVLVLMVSGADWLQVVLGCIKVGAVTVPCSPKTPGPALEARIATTGASLIVADHASDRELAQLSHSPEVHHLVEDGIPGPDAPSRTETHDTSSRDVAFIVTSSGTTSGPREIAHTHGATFATRVQAEHWLDAARGDAVWCTADTGSAQTIWSGLVGPWSRGAELILHHGEFDPLERLDLVHRLGATILCQTPAEYRALAKLRVRDLERYQSQRLRRLVSTGDYLEPDVVAVFEEAWGMTIHDGYGQAETNVVVANGADSGFKPGSLGLPLPGHQVSVVDRQGNELPPGIEGDLAVRGRPPTLFAGYWDSPDETKGAFTGDWYLTGDVAARDEDGFLWFVGRASDIIASRGHTFGPHEVEKALRGHTAVVNAAVVGVRDLARGGHFVRAFVVLEPRARRSELLEAELRQHVADALPEQHVPREVEFVDHLPVTATGNIDREGLRETAVVARPLWEPDTEADASATALQDAEPAPAPFEPEHVELPPEAFVADPEPVPPAPEPVVEPAPAPIPEPEPAPAALVEPEPIPEPVLDPYPDAVDPIPEPVVEQVVEPMVETPPEPAPAVEFEPTLLPDYIVAPAETPEPVARAQPEPEPEPEEEEDFGPLPDYIVDPERPPLEPVPAPPMQPAEQQPEPEPSAPPEEDSPLAGLGLKPVTEFPRRDDGAERDPSSATRRPTAPPSAKPDRDRSEGEPGDEGEEIGWMQGLSSRLSAYSLGADLDDDDTPEDDDETAREDEEPLGDDQTGA